MSEKTPIALTVAGSDSGGGAGIQADLKAISAQGVFGASALTAITAQNTQAVTAVHEIPAEVVAAQITAVLDDLDVAAIKLGMLFSPAIIEAVADALSDFKGAIVVDPVMIAKSGDALLQDHAITALKKDILPLATLLTPNLPEAARLLETSENVEMEAQAKALKAHGPKAVLLKDGHGGGAICSDLLLGDDDTVTRLDAPRINTKNTHGTGCTYSASIAANLAKGMQLTDAVTEAHSYLHQAIARADTLTIGSGHGPVHHFHAMWS
ncbi:MAG: bifunctional hydroxymethylpyrimidine kinase/phosphomethylpyrimidine kinase [Litoreibacter sp.]|nr:bifunctional hydroxymethylpyrimidine kinase/phosphomethylpyrimidine kinase [Litoreibacter sp.]MCY4336003.1 bifunctional hydroxymethylpyrimidine kinase/phosphomethylpyrimidine kinase [Litoreibacter sp.]